MLTCFGFTVCGGGNTRLINDTYQKNLLERGHNFAIGINGGWLMGKVLKKEQPSKINFNRYNTMAAGANTSSIGSDSPSTWNSWKTSQNYDIFNEWDSDILLQAFIGIGPKPLRLFRQFPTPSTRGGLSRIPVTGAFDDETPGYVDGYMSPYHNPTVATEMLIPRSTFIEFGLYNPLSYPVNPVFNIVFQRMKVHYFDPDNSHDANQIENIQNGHAAVKFWDPGIAMWQYDAVGSVGVDVIPEWRR